MALKALNPFGMPQRLRFYAIGSVTRHAGIMGCDILVGLIVRHRLGGAFGASQRQHSDYRHHNRQKKSIANIRFPSG